MAKYRTADGANLYYRVRGSASDLPPMILIHGWCSNQSHWDPVIRHFVRKHRILSVDRRGMGRSTTPGTAHTAAQHASDIAAIARLVGMRGAVVVGHAGGGPVALTLTRDQPRLARATVMIDSGLYDLPRIGDPADAFGTILGNMISALQGPKGKQALKQMYTGYFSKKFDRAARDRAVADALETPLQTAVDELQMMVVSTQAIADDIKRPVLWLTAAQADQAYIRSHLQKVQFGQVVGAGHFPQLEVPGQTCAMIETFIEQL